MRDPDPWVLIAAIAAFGWLLNAAVQMNHDLDDFRAEADRLHAVNNRAFEEMLKPWDLPKP